MKIKIKRLRMRKLRDMLGDEGGIGCFEICIGWNYPDLIALIPQCGSFAADCITVIPEWGTCVTTCLSELAGIGGALVTFLDIWSDVANMLGFICGK
jgi:hypothetical protein